MAPGPPTDPETFSGASASLLRELSARDALVAAVDGRPSALTRLEQAASFSIDSERWRQWHNAGASRISPAIRWAMSEIAARRAAARLDGADALLQMTGWFAPRLPRRKSLLRCAYHDGNVAVFLRRPDLRLRRDARRIRWALSFERQLHHDTDVVLAMSEWLRESFIDDFGLDAGRVVAVGAGANIPLPAAAPERDFSRPRVLFPGKQFERKGGREVLRAFAALRSRRPDAELWIVGPQHLRVDEPGVRVLGRVRRADAPGGMPDLYRRATLLAMPSFYDPFPTVFREAMAYRLPCIGSTSCSIPEMVLDGVTGYVVPAGDHAALAERMIELAEDPDKAQRFGEAGFKRYCERYTWAGTAERIVRAVVERL